MALPCCTSADLSESSSLETVVNVGSSSDNILTLGGLFLISHFLYYLLNEFLVLFLLALLILVSEQ